jgi:hypothetical protein
MAMLPVIILATTFIAMSELMVIIESLATPSLVARIPLFFLGSPPSLAKAVSSY